MERLRREGLGLAAGSAALLIGALGFQYIGGLAPCHLCLLQRVPHALAIVLGLTLVALPRRGIALLGTVVMAVGVGLAGYHVGVEQGWWPGPTSCAAPVPGAMSSGDLLNQILATPVVLCDQIAWSLWGISMAGWNGIASLLLAMLWARSYASSSASQ